MGLPLLGKGLKARPVKGPREKGRPPHPDTSPSRQGLKNDPDGRASGIERKPDESDRLFNPDSQGLQPRVAEIRARPRTVAGHVSPSRVVCRSQCGRARGIRPAQRGDGGEARAAVPQAGLGREGPGRGGAVDLGRAPFPCRGDIGALPAGVPWGRGGGYPHATQNRPGRALGAFRLPFLTRGVFGPFSGTGTPHSGIVPTTRGPTGPRRPGGRPMTRERAPDRAEGLDRARRPKNRFPGFFARLHPPWPLSPVGPGLFRPPPPRRPEGERGPRASMTSRTMTGDGQTTPRAHTGPQGPTAKAGPVRAKGWPGRRPPRRKAP